MSVKYWVMPVFDKNPAMQADAPDFAVVRLDSHLQERVIERVRKEDESIDVEGCVAFGSKSGDFGELDEETLIFHRGFCQLLAGYRASIKQGMLDDGIESTMADGDAVIRMMESESSLVFETGYFRHFDTDAALFRSVLAEMHEDDMEFRDRMKVDLDPIWAQEAGEALEVLAPKGASSTSAPGVL